MTTLDEKGLEAAIVAGNRSYNELRSRFDDAIYAAIRAYLAAAPGQAAPPSVSGAGDALKIEVCKGQAGLALYVNDERVAGPRHNGVMQTVLSAEYIPPESINAEAARWKEAAEQADARCERLLDHAEDVATRRVNAEALAAEHAQREAWTRERAERAESINAEMLEALRLARSQIDDFETNDATLKQIDDLIARAEAAGGEG